MTIDCLDDELRDLLPGFAHGRLGSVERERVSAHLAGCAACAHELEIIRAARASFARVRPVDTGRIVAMLPSPPGRPALRVERGEGLSVRRGAWSRRSALRIAAGIMVLAVGGVSLKVASESGPGSVAVGDLPSGSSASPGAVPNASETRVPVETIAPSPARATAGGSTPALRPRPGSLASVGGMTFGGGVSDLSDDELRALLADLDALDAVPSAEPEAALGAIGFEEGR